MRRSTDRRAFLELTGLGMLGIAAGCSGPGTDTSKPPGETDTDDTNVEETGDTDTGEGPTCTPTESGIAFEGRHYISSAPMRTQLGPVVEGRHQAVPWYGRVLDTRCRPVAGAIVEVWHRSPEVNPDTGSAEYDMTGTMNYRGRVEVSETGEFHVLTAAPGREGTGETYRPAHMHVKVKVDGVDVLTTMLFFKGDPYNPFDERYDEARELVFVDESGVGEGRIIRYDLILDL